MEKSGINLTRNLSPPSHPPIFRASLVQMRVVPPDLATPEPVFALVLLAFSLGFSTPAGVVFLPLEKRGKNNE